MQEAALNKGLSLFTSLRNRVHGVTETLQQTHGSFTALADKAFGPLPPLPPNTTIGTLASTPGAQYEGEAGDLERALSELESVASQVQVLTHRFAAPLD